MSICLCLLGHKIEDGETEDSAEEDFAGKQVSYFIAFNGLYGKGMVGYKWE